MAAMTASFSSSESMGPPCEGSRSSGRGALASIAASLFCSKVRQELERGCVLIRGKGVRFWR